MYREEIKVHHEIRNPINNDAPAHGHTELHGHNAPVMVAGMEYPGKSSEEGKGHKYITPVYDMKKSGVDYIAYDRKKKSLDEYYNTLTEEDISWINAVSMALWDPFMSSTMKHVPNADSKIVLIGSMS